MTLTQDGNGITVVFDNGDVLYYEKK